MAKSNHFIAMEEAATNEDGGGGPAAAGRGPLRPRPDRRRHCMPFRPTSNTNEESHRDFVFFSNKVDYMISWYSKRFSRFIFSKVNHDLELNAITIVHWCSGCLQ